ncbi:hypothetical protein MesoLjLc_52920 [Mesorhizobium sp. L-8-10]|nr:hypothetical protein MesoLjLc_52920 [Mesorhizobium sp. L-8-10]
MHAKRLAHMRKKMLGRKLLGHGARLLRIVAATMTRGLAACKWWQLSVPGSITCRQGFVS